MKIRRFFLYAVLSALLMTGCDAFRKVTQSNAHNSQGKAYELIVACSQEQWTGMVGDSLRAIFTASVPYLNQTEPRFDVVRVTESGLTGLVAAHRNILKVVVDPTLKEASTAVQYDLTAQPQIVMTLQGPTSLSLVDYLSANGEKLVQALEMAERKRAVEQNAAYGNEALEAVIRTHFGMNMNVPQGYVKAAEQDDFVWARYEYPTASQGFFIYSYPYAGPQSLTPAALIAARNQFAAHIPGPSDGSYMTTSEVFEPAFSVLHIGDRQWCELRGFWDVEGDFMGGPFVSYTTVDAATNRVVTLDCYVYSPKLHKRNFVRGVEHLVYGITFEK